MSNDLTANIKVGTGDSSAQVTGLAKAVRGARETIAALAAELPTLDKATAANARAISAVLTSYTKAATLATAWATATLKSAEADKVATNTNRTLAQAIAGTAAAVSKLTGIDKESFDAKSRTIALLQAQSNADKTAAESIKLLAQAENEEARAAKARAQAGVVTNGSPLTAYQAANVAAKEAAAAAAAKAAADRQAALAAQQAASATQSAAVADRARTAALAAEIRMLISAAQAQQQATNAASVGSLAAQRSGFAALQAQQQSRVAGLSNAQLQAQIAARTAASQAAQTSATRNLLQQQALLAGGGDRARAVINEVSGATDKQTNSLHGSYFAMYQVAAAYGVLSAAALGVVGSTVSVAASFEKAFLQVERVTGLQTASSALTYLKDQLISLSGQVPLSFEELSGVATAAGQLGIASDQIANFTGVIARFSALTNVSLDQATLGFGKLFNLAGIGADKFEQEASSIAQLGASSAATESEILNVSTAIAAATKQAGFGTQDMNGLATALASLKVAPELAKGAVTRVFAQITRDVNAGGKALAPYAELLHTTTSNVENLQRSNPASFFLQLVSAMSSATAAGQDLTSITDSLGIKNTRDVQVIARLAGNYKLLGDNIQLAYTSFQKPPDGQDDYLTKSSKLIFSGFSDSLKETQNQFRAFQAGVGESALAPLKGVLFLVQNLIQVFDKVPAAITAPIIAVTAIVGAFAAFKAATALALAGTLAFKNVLGTSTVGSVVSLRTLKSALVDTFGTGGVVAEQSAGVIAASEFRMSESAIAANVSLARQTAVVAALGETLTGSSIATQRYAATQLLMAQGLNASRTAISSQTAAVIANTSAGNVATLRTTLYSTAVALETLTLDANGVALTEQAILANAASATLFRNAAGALTAAETTTALTAAQIRQAAAAETGAVANKLWGLSVGGWIGVVATAAIAIGTGIYAALQSSNKASADSAEAMAKNKAAFVDAAGGVDVLNKALVSDTKAFEDAGNRATAANGVVELYTRTIKDLKNGTAEVTDAFINAKTQEPIGQPVVTLVANYAGTAQDAADRTKNMTDAQKNLSAQTGITYEDLTRTTVAIGKQTQAIEAAAIRTLLFGKDLSGGILGPDKQKLILEAGSTVKKLLTASLSPDPTAVDRQFDAYNAQLTKRIAAAKAIMSSEGAKGTSNSIAFRDAKAELETVQTLKDKEQELKDAFTAGNGSIRDQITNLQAAGAASEDLSSAIDGTTGAAGGAATGLENLGEKADPVTKKLSDMASGFTALISSAFDMQDALGGSEAALEALGAGLVANGTDFSNYTESGRTNLANLKEAVSTYAAQQAESIKQGAISTEEGARNVSEYISTLVQSLASKGVDTSQIQFLVNYIQQVTSSPATLVVDADTSGATQKVVDLADNVRQLGLEIASAGAQSFNNPHLGEVSTGSQGPQAVTPGAVAGPNTAAESKYRIGLAQAEAQAAKDMADAQANAEAASTGAEQAYNDAMDAAKAKDTAASQGAKQTAADQRDAGKAAKDSQKDQADGAQRAADALAKQKQYLQDVGSFYAKLGTEAFGGAAGISKIAESLQKVGTSLATNGTSFSAFTDSGRSNLDAVGSALDAYGDHLQRQLGDGSLTVNQAGAAFKAYASTVEANLLRAGVPAKEIKGYFDALGASPSLANSTAETAKFSGVLNEAQKRALSLGTTATQTFEGIALSADEASKYLAAVNDYFTGLSEGAFKFVNAEGAVFSGLQDLGKSIAENGKGFNTFSEGGRKNFEALGSVVESFQKNIQTRVAAGAISAQAGARQLSSFTGVVYRELLGLGVKASQIAPILRSLGLNTRGGANDRATDQYRGVLTAAQKAAAAAAVSQEKLNEKMAIAADYADRLTAAFNAQFDSLYGLSNAQDAATSSAQGLKDTLTQNLETVQSLTKANADLQNGMTQDQSDINVFNKQIAIASRYGQKDKVKDLTAKRSTTEADLADKQNTVKKNAAQILEIKRYGSALTGNTKQAIANRAAYQGLEKDLLAQVAAYAKTGASSAQVTEYTKKLQSQLLSAGKAAGYSRKDIKTYTDQFGKFAVIAAKVPARVTTAVQVVGLTAAQNALAGIVGNGTFTTQAIADSASIAQAKAALLTVPKASGYTIAPSVHEPSRAYSVGVLSRIPKSSDYTVRVTIPRSGLAGSVSNAIRSIPTSGGYSIHTAADGVTLARSKAAISQAITTGRYAVSTVLGAVGLSLGGNISARGGLSASSGSVNRFTSDSIYANGGISAGGGMNIGGTVTAPNANFTAVYTPRWTGAPRPVFRGGMVGMAAGGLIPGTPPSDPTADNVPAFTQTGNPLIVRSREYIQPQPAVDYYGVGMMNAIRNRTFPKVGAQRFAGGGQPMSGGSYSGYAANGAPVTVQLSLADRKMLNAALNRPVIAAIDGHRLDAAQNTKAASARRSGV